MPFFYLLAIVLNISFANNEQWLQKNSQWLDILHYEKDIWGNWASRAAGEGFFYSKSRKPYDEFIAYKKAILKNQKEFKQPDDHPICKYPMRLKYLKRNFQDIKTAKVTCKEYDQYIEDLNAESLSLVFSSYYIESPSSAFGHTFLRIHQPKKSKKVDLLDFGIGYAASPTTSNPLLYTIYGFTGGFPGEFTKVPFYYKVREYNDFETRDLWTYHLDLTKQEVEDIVDHLWEVSHTYFPYYYLTENCAYYLLEIIEMVAPRYNMLERIPFWIIPIDTVKAAIQAGAVTDIDYRPSAYRVFIERFGTLNDKQKDLFYKVLKSKNWEILKDQARVIDALLDYIDVKYYQEVADKTNEWAKHKYKLNVLRANLDQKVEELNIRPANWEKPHSIYPLRRFRTSIGHSDQSYSYLNLQHRFANHDILDSLNGKPPFSNIEFLKTEFYIDKKRFLIQDITLVSAIAFPETTKLFKRTSWGFSVGAKHYSEVCTSCISPYIEFGMGYSFNFIPNRLQFSALFWLETLVEDQVDKGYSARLGPYLQIAYYPLMSTRILLLYQPSIELRDSDIDYHKLSFNLRQDLSKTTSLGLEAWENDFEKRAQASFYFYY